jgi:steroid 5-alpha reductase family enzyme
MDIILLIFICFSLFFLVGTKLKNNSIVDIGWGFGFVIVAWYTYLRDNSVVAGQFIITLLISIWVLRQFYHIAKRGIGKGEDVRYISFRKTWGNWVVPRSFIQVYMLQSFFLYLISLTVIQTAYQGIEADSLLLLPGVFLWFIGFFFEAIDDYQLHLGEAAMWWGIFLIAIVSGAPAWTIISPLVITFLLLYVSGLQLLEKSIKKTRL